MSLVGRLEDLSLADILQIISLSKRSGTLTISKKEGEGYIYFNRGQVIYASVYNKKKLGELLVDKNIIKEEELKRALQRQEERGMKEPLGTILIEMGLTLPGQLEQIVKTHIIEVIQEFLNWDTGSFTFVLRDEGLDKREILFKNGMSTEFMLLERARLQDEILSGKEPAGGPAVYTEQIDETQAEEIEESKKEEIPSGDLSDREAGKKDLSLLTSMIEELAGPATSSEITLMVLRFASEIMNRAVIFLVKDEDVNGLGQFGLSFEDHSADEKVRAIKMPLKEPSVFRNIVLKKTPYKGKLIDTKWNRYLVESLGGIIPHEVFVCPLISDNKVIAILYGDNIPRREPIGNTEGLEAFIKMAGVALGKALLEKKYQSSKHST